MKTFDCDKCDIYYLSKKNIDFIKNILNEIALFYIAL